MTGGTIRTSMQKAATKRGVQITAAGIAAGALLLAGILVCVSPDVPDDWPLAAFPVFLESALAHTLDAVTVTPVSNISDGGTHKLEGATSTDTIQLRTGVYAFVASVDDDGVQAINLANMNNPVVAGSIGDDDTNELDGAYGIKIFIHGNNLYAAVTASEDDGVQILTVTNPSNITTAGQVSDSGIRELQGARGIDVIDIDGRNYAIVAGHEDNGVEILNLTDPTANPLPSSDSISDNSTLALAGAIDAKFFKLEGDDKTYAVVAASTDNGIQVLNVTNPANVMAVNSMSDSPDLLRQPYSVDVFEHNTRTYAIVAARSDHGVQLLDLTDLPDIVPAGSISASNNDGSSTVVLNTPISVTAFKWSGNQYAAVGTETSGMQILDIRDPRNPAAAGGIDAGNVTNAKVSNMTDVDVVGGQSIVIATVDDGVQILELEENPTTNSLPVVVMMNQTADGGDVVTLNATVTDTDDTTLIYDWSYEIPHANPLRIEIADEESLETTFVAPHVRNGATAVFKLRVTDHHGGETTGTMQVTINPNQPPAVSAGPDLTIYEGVTITLVGYADDPDGDDFNISKWTHQPASPAITIDEDGTFTAPQVSGDTTYTFNLTATDEHGLSASDTAIIRVLDNDHTRIDPSLVGSINDNGTINLDGTNYIGAFFVSGVPYAAVAASEDGAVTTINLSDPDNPAISGTVTVNDANGLDIFHTSDIPYAAVTSYDNRVLSIINLSDPANPSVAGRIENEYATDDVAVFETSGNTWAVTASSSNAFSVFHLNDPANPTLAGSIDNIGNLTFPTRLDISYVSGIPYVVVTALIDANVHVLNMSDPANPTHAAVVASDASFYESPLDLVTGIAAFDVSGIPYAAAAGTLNGVLQVINLNDPANPTLHGNFTDYYWLSSISYLDTFEWSGTTWAAATAGSGDVHVFDLTDPANPALASNATRLLDTITPAEIATFGYSGNIYAAVASSYDSSVHTVRITANDPPDVRAGPDQTVAEQQTVTLTGTVTDSDPPIEYHWTHNGTGLGVTLDDDRAAATTFTAPSVAADTTIRFTLTATDSLGAAASAAVHINVTDTDNQPPTARAGANQTVNENEMVMLNGTGSTDPDWGTVLTYDWTHNGTDLGITLSNTAVAEPTFTSPYVAANTTLTFRLTVTDEHGLSASDTTTVTVIENKPPTADAGANQTVNENVRVMLNGTDSTDPDDTTLTYEWNQTAGPPVALSDATAAETDFTSPKVAADTTLTFTLEVSDGAATDTDDVYITVEDTDNWPPTADAGANQTVNERVRVMLNGTGSTDPDHGTTLTYLWAHNSTLPIALASDTAATTTFTAPSVDADTTIRFTLTVTDDHDATASDSVDVTIRDTGMPDFVTTWRTTASNESITIPVRWAEGNYTINWGDGASSSYDDTGSKSHAYAAPGEHTVRISGNLTRIYLGGDPDNAAKIISIDQWGDIRWASMRSAFEGASNMAYNAADVPDLSRVAIARSMFHNASSFNGDLSGWDVSSVTNMHHMFYHASSFNGDLSGWDVSSVTDMHNMFLFASSFNGDISEWDVSSVTDMSFMFYNARSFNGNISGWDVSSVTNMREMFFSAHSFNQSLNAWDVSSVTNMHDMFNGARLFQQNLGNWYIVPDGTTINAASTPGIVAGISAQNAYLDSQNPTYRIGTGGDSDSFSMNGINLIMDTVPNKRAYIVNITSTGDFGDNNHRILEMSVTGNRPPAADAGEDQTVGENELVALDGTNSSYLNHGTTLTYDWTHNGTDLGITLSNTAVAEPTFTSPYVAANTTITFRLEVSDGTDTDTDTVDITVKDTTNRPPTADAGDDQDANEGDTVTLDGTGSTDPDRGTTLTYDWTHNGTDLGITLFNNKTAEPTFTSPYVAANTTITFRLEVSDGTDTDTAEVHITVLDAGTPSDFVTTWRTTAPNESITIPVSGDAGTYTVEWGDGSPPEIGTGDMSHQYTKPGDHIVRISGDLTGIQLGGDPTNAARLASIDQWGDIRWSSMNLAFEDASNMVYNAADVPDLSRVTDMSGMFRGASSFNGDISGWDVSAVTNMSYTFRGASSFNQPLNAWNVSAVTDMSGMLVLASSFNQPLNAWDVSAVTDMSAMFFSASSFNGDISSWNVSAVTTMYGMFFDASSFNQPLNAWNVSAVTTMYGMFWDASSFNQPLNAWNVSAVTTMYGMFFGASSFNQPLNAWNVSAVTTMADMFRGASSFNGNISSWDVSAVTTMADMFYRASSFNQPLNAWDVSAVTNMRGMLVDASSFEQNLGNWYIVPDGTTINAASTPGIVAGISAQNAYLDSQNPTYRIEPGGDSDSFSMNGINLVMDAVPTKPMYDVNITSTGDFGTGNHRILKISVTGNLQPTADAGANQIVDENEMVTLNGTASDLDGGQLTYSWTHNSTLAIVLANDTATTTTFTAPFVAANTTIRFNLTATDEHGAAASDTVDITIRYTGTPSDFITTWRTTAPDERITIPVSGADGNYTINWGDGASSSYDDAGDRSHAYTAPGDHIVRISGDLTGIQLGGDPTNAARLASIDQWGDIRWSSMNLAFEDASNMVYNAADVPDLSRVTDMSGMFRGASSFNGDISGWDVSAVTNMSYTFRGASSFNQPLNAWNVSAVTDMSGMLVLASSFNQPLNAWDVSAVTDMSAMFFSASSFNGDISSWNVSAVTTMYGMFFDASSFNQPLNAWNVSAVTTMYGMFWDASSFNQPLNAWNVSAVTTMYGMFFGASSFNQPLNAWNVSAVTTMADMFRGASSFNGNISSWDVSAVTTMADMFYRASSFNQPLNAWDVSAVTNMRGMLVDASSFEQNLGNWYIVPDGTTINAASTPGIVAGISAQNAYLDSQNPTYRIEPGGDSDSFSMNGINLVMDAVPTKPMYDVNITSTGDFGTGNHRILKISVTGNLQPTADAGANQIVDENEMVTLNGTASDLDGGQLTYSWTHNSTLAIVLANDTATTTTFTAPFVAANTTIRFNLTATDEHGAAASDTVDITVKDIANQRPMANAGANQTVNENEMVMLNGTASSDLDGTTLTYKWTQTAGPTVTLFNNKTAEPTFTAPEVSANTNITFSLEVSDGTDTATAEVDITVRHVNKPPAVSAGPDLTIYEGVTITLVGYADDPDGDDFNIPQWTHQPASPAITIDEDGTFTAPQVSGDTTYTFNLTATDEHGLSASDTAIIRVLDNDHTRIDPSLVGSINDNGTINLDGTNYIGAFFVSGVPYAAVAASEDGAVTTINLSDPDNPAISGTVTVNDANGLDIFHTSDIPYAAVTSYDNRVLSIINLSDPANPSVAGRIENEYATDDVAVFETSGNTWAVTASSSNAFSVFHLNDPANPTLAGSIDNIGNLTFPTRLDISYVSGIPYVVVTALIDANVHVLNMSDPANPTHAAVVASDASFYESPLDLVTGIAAFDVSGIPYAAAAGTLNGVLQVINLNDPANPTLHGNFTDYYWLSSISYLDTFEWSGTTWAAATAGSGDVHVFDLTDPANPALASNATRLLDTITPAEIATFGYSGNIYAAVASSYDSSVHTVRITANDPPDVRAGPDQTVAEQQTVTLTGTVTDSDPPIEYHWTHNGTGLGVTLDDDRAAATTFTAPSVAADTTIRFTLTATDSLGAAASAAVHINVTDTDNQPPTARAGANQTVNENEMVMLNGTGSTDPDWGTVLTYDWTHNGTDLGITLSNTAVAEPTFTSPYVAANTTITFRLEVSDGTDTDTDTVDITVKDTTNRPPTADAGDDQDANEGDTVTLDGTGSTDPDRGTTLTYDWTHNGTDLGITLFNNKTAEPTFTSPYVAANTTITFTLEVSDGTDTDTAEVHITVLDAGTPSDFVTTWTTAEANQAILLPVSGSGITINWGDGATVTGVSGPQSHTYGSAGNWTVTVTGGLERFHLNKSQSSALLSSIDQWGNSSWTSMENAFYGASEMTYSATDAPDLSGVASTAGMFREASSFNGNISSWDVSRVTNMSRLFQDASSFNGNISSWNVSAVTDMSAMFFDASSFNQPLGSWDVSSVTTMRSMFTSAHSFNQPLNAWDVSAVTTMRSMFFEASSFNQPLNAWDVSSVTTMRTMFHASSFNQTLDGWDVSAVTNMHRMFSSARSFNQPLNAWDVSAVTDMSNMFYSARSFNQTLDGWDVSSVTNMQWMFTAASSFNQPLNAWNVSGVTTMHRMFGGATSFNQTLDGWDVSAVTNMHRMFTGASSFNQPLNAWDVSSVTNMQRMFTSAHSFNGNISSWDVSAVTDMSDMFHQASSFNQPLGSWDVSSVTTMRAMFQDASSFNQPLNAWDVSAVTDMYQMFAKASSFNQPLGSWDVSSVTEMHNMFGSYPSFGQNLGPWYIVPDDPRPAVSAVDRVAANITAQNPFLSGQGPDYRVTGDHADLFEMAGAGNATLQLKPNQAAVSGTTYNVTVAATGDSLFGAGNARTVQVTVRNAHNSPPTADAGDDRIVLANTQVTLNGTNSTDPDHGTMLTYKWTQTSGHTVTLFNATAAKPTFTAPQVYGGTILTFSLEVSDGTATASDKVEITVQNPYRERSTGISCGSATVRQSFTFPQKPPGHFSTGISVEGHIMYVISQRSSDKTPLHEIRAFNISSGFTPVANHATPLPTELSDGITTLRFYDIWASASSDGYILALEMALQDVWKLEVGNSTKQNVTVPGLNTVNRPGGIWNSPDLNRGYILSGYVDRNAFQKIYAYSDLNSKNVTRLPASDIPVHHVTLPGGLWSDGATIWTTDLERCVVVAYDLDTGQRVPALDINGTVAAPRGLAGDPDNMRMWVLDGLYRAVAYDMPTTSESGNLAPPDPARSSHDLIEGKAWSYELGSSQKGHLTLSGNIPVGFTLDRNDRTLYWMPSDGQAGSYTVRVTGSANNGATILSETILDLSVSENVPPKIVFYLSATQTINLGEDYRDRGVVCEDDVDESRQIFARAAPNTDIAGVHTLIYECTDSFGHRAVPAKRILTVVDPNLDATNSTNTNSTDSTPPTLSLNEGPSSILQHDPYGDPGATCTDDTDPTRVVYADPPLDTSVLGPHLLAYGCTDAADNVADPLTRSVLVRAPPPPVTTNSTDSTPPTLSLNEGPDSVTQHDPYGDPGATCTDDTDPTRVVYADPPLDTSVLGPHLLAYGCTDAADNAADPLTRSVLVKAPPPPITTNSTNTNSTTPVNPNTNSTDSTPPTLSLNEGPDSVTQHDPYGDPGATCTDDTDPTRVVYADPPLDTSVLGPHLLAYGCTDAADNAADPLTRSVLVKAPPPPITTNSTNTNSTTPVNPNTNSTDSTPPTLSLNEGPDSVTQHDPYGDPGATCTDDTDPTRVVYADPPLDTSVLGPHLLAYGCTDAADNAADPLTRSVLVKAPPPPNRPPVLLEIGDRTVTEHSEVSFVVSASDDLEDVLTYSASGMPEGASFDETTGLFRWTPSERQGPGAYQVTFGVTDGTDAGQPQTVTITVAESNLPPEFEARAAEGYRCNTAPGSVVTATITVTDPDLPAQELSVVSGIGDLDYSASISGGTLSFSATIPDDPEEIPDDHRFIFRLMVDDDHDPPGRVGLSIFLYLPEAGETTWPDC